MCFYTTFAQQLVSLPSVNRCFLPSFFINALIYFTLLSQSNNSKWGTMMNLYNFSELPLSFVFVIGEFFSVNF